MTDERRPALNEDSAVKRRALWLLPYSLVASGIAVVGGLLFASYVAPPGLTLGETWWIAALNLDILFGLVAGAVLAKWQNSKEYQ
jgi:hypothetical protein